MKVVIIKNGQILTVEEAKEQYGISSTVTEQHIKEIHKALDDMKKITPPSNGSPS